MVSVIMCSRRLFNFLAEKRLRIPNQKWQEFFRFRTCARRKRENERATTHRNAQPHRQASECNDIVTRISNHANTQPKTHTHTHTHIRPHTQPHNFITPLLNTRSHHIAYINYLGDRRAMGEPLHASMHMYLHASTQRLTPKVPPWCDTQCVRKDTFRSLAI